LKQNKKISEEAIGSPSASLLRWVINLRELFDAYLPKSGNTSDEEVLARQTIWC